jgi:PIN domain nuclease of toxin-antitoxin system
LRPLLDTHPFIWFLVERKRIPERLMATLLDPSHVSAATIWEVAINAGLGKLSFPLDRLEAITDEAGFSRLCVTSAHAFEVRHLPPLNRDPFDRLLVAQVWYERLTLVTRDPDIRRYPVDALWE